MCIYINELQYLNGANLPPTACKSVVSAATVATNSAMVTVAVAVFTAVVIIEKDWPWNLKKVGGYVQMSCCLFCSNLRLFCYDECHLVSTE